MQDPEALLTPTARPAPVVPFQGRGPSSASLNQTQSAAVSPETESWEAAPLDNFAQRPTSARTADWTPRLAAPGRGTVQQALSSAAVSTVPAPVRHARVQAVTPSAPDEAAPELRPALGEVHRQRLLQTDQSDAGIQVGTVLLPAGCRCKFLKRFIKRCGFVLVNRQR